MRIAGMLLALLATDALAATAYVSDQLILGVYATQITTGPRLATLHSGAAVDALTSAGDATEVRLADGTTGWVKSAYLTNVEPATSRLKQLQDELDRAHATTPALAEAAERSEVERLTHELAAAKAALAAAQRVTAGAATPATPPASATNTPWRWITAFAAIFGVGVWVGYALLARRIRRRFGGIKVY